MSHVVSSQPSATSPYQPTAVQDVGNGTNYDNPPRILRTNSEQGEDNCCIHTRNRNGCCFVVCRLLFLCCQGFQNCTESCCNCCANCLNDCCEDKPEDNNRRNYNQRYKNSGGIYYDNTTDNNDDWGINSLSPQLMHVGIDSHNSEPGQDSLIQTSSDHQNSPTHHTGGHDSGTHHTTSAHDSGTHHTSGHDSSTHHTSGHDSGTHHTSGHDSGTCDAGGGGYDSGGGFDSGGGCDTGGGDDSGGGCDSGGGGCDD